MLASLSPPPPPPLFPSATTAAAACASAAAVASPAAFSRAAARSALLSLRTAFARPGSAAARSLTLRAYPTASGRPRNCAPCSARIAAVAPARSAKVRNAWPRSASVLAAATQTTAPCGDAAACSSSRSLAAGSFSGRLRTYSVRHGGASAARAAGAGAATIRGRGAAARRDRAAGLAGRASAPQTRPPDRFRSPPSRSRAVHGESKGRTARRRRVRAGERFEHSLIQRNRK
jgi:hypothetical protein